MPAANPARTDVPVHELIEGRFSPYAFSERAIPGEDLHSILAMTNLKWVKAFNDIGAADVLLKKPGNHGFINFPATILFFTGNQHKLLEPGIFPTALLFPTSKLVLARVGLE